MNYDAFISYSHAADGKLAPAIQKGLQKIARPFHKRRALKVFRDETNLSATPHLWNTIENNLKESKYFILLASPQAAKSKWVNKEIEFWLEHKSIDTLLLGITAGEIEWDESKRGFNWEKSSALPSILKGKFYGEPLFIDFRKEKTSSDLSIRNPIFKNKVAALAATVHKKSIDDLIGEDLKEHRKFIAFRNFGIALVLGLALGMSIFAWLSNKNAKEAKYQERIANKNAQMARDTAEVAKYERQRALDSALEAQSQRDTAKKNLEEFKRSHSNYLTAEAEKHLENEEVRLSLLLVKAAIKINPNNIEAREFLVKLNGYLSITINNVYGIDEYNDEKIYFLSPDNEKILFVTNFDRLRATGSLGILNSRNNKISRIDNYYGDHLISLDYNLFFSKDNTRMAFFSKDSKRRSSISLSIWDFKLERIISKIPNPGRDVEFNYDGSKVAYYSPRKYNSGLSKLNVFNISNGEITSFSNVSKYKFSNTEDMIYFYTDYDANKETGKLNQFDFKTRKTRIFENAYRFHFNNIGTHLLFYSKNEDQPIYELKSLSQFDYHDQSLISHSKVYKYELSPDKGKIIVLYDYDTSKKKGEILVSDIIDSQKVSLGSASDFLVRWKPYLLATFIRNDKPESGRLTIWDKNYHKLFEINQVEEGSYKFAHNENKIIFITNYDENRQKGTLNLYDIDNRTIDIIGEAIYIPGEDCEPGFFSNDKMLYFLSNYTVDSTDFYISGNLKVWDITQRRLHTDSILFNRKVRCPLNFSGHSTTSSIYRFGSGIARYKVLNLETLEVMNFEHSLEEDETYSSIFDRRIVSEFGPKLETLSVLEKYLNAITIWDVDNSDKIRTLKHVSDIVEMEYLDNETIISSSIDKNSNMGTIKVTTFVPGKETISYYEKIFKPLSKNEKKRYGLEYFEQ